MIVSNFIQVVHINGQQFDDGRHSVHTGCRWGRVMWPRHGVDRAVGTNDTSGPVVVAKDNHFGVGVGNGRLRGMDVAPWWVRVVIVSTDALLLGCGPPMNGQRWVVVPLLVTIDTPCWVAEGSWGAVGWWPYVALVKSCMLWGASVEAYFTLLPLHISGERAVEVRSPS